MKSINEFERKIYINIPHDKSVQPPTPKKSKGQDEKSNPPTTEMSTRIIQVLIIQLILQVIIKTIAQIRLNLIASLSSYGKFILASLERKKPSIRIKKPEKSKKSRMKPLKTGYTSI